LQTVCSAFEVRCELIVNAYESTRRLVQEMSRWSCADGAVSW